MTFETEASSDSAFWQARQLMLPAIRTRKFTLAAMLALTVVQGGLVGASPLFLKWVVDALGQDPRSQEAIIWGLVYIVTLAVARVSAEIQMLAFGNLEQGFIHHIRTKAFSHIVSLPLSFHLDQHPGRLNQRISSGSNSVTMLLQVLANIALPAIIQIVMAVVIIAASGDLQIAAVFVASFSLYGAIYYWATRRLVARQRKAADAAADLGATLTDGLLHPETSKYLNAEEALSERIGQQSGKTGAAWVKFYRERVRAQLLVTAVFAMTLAVTILLSLDSVRAGTLGVGGFVMITTYALQVVRPLETLGVIYRESLRGWVQLKEVLQLLSLEPERTGGAALPSGPLEIELDEVHLKYDGKEPTLLGCTLSVQAGKKVAIVGASGSGKSTIMRILAGLYSPEEGEIRIGGTSVSLIDRKLLRRRLGVVPQDTALFDGTIGWNIAVGCEGASTNDIARAAEQVGISAFINKLPEKYETPVGQRGLKLSGGERQRIGLARMALRYPGLIILDEPTSSLDTSTETEINSAIQKQFPDSTVITFSHRLYSIQNSEEILVLDQGRIQEKGTHRELLSRGGLYARMWNDQQTGNDPDAE